MIIATNNNGKIKELKSILGPDLKSLKEAGLTIDVVEDANTFYGNALKKACEIFKICQEPVIADDSGLCIDSLDGFPGVLTHRFLGEGKNDNDRNLALIEKLKNNPNRNAEVICILVYYDGKNTLVGEGVLNGKITTSPRGTNGFGFDPIFELATGQTLAELTPSEKNQKSARYLAALDLKNKLNELNNSPKLKK